MNEHTSCRLRHWELDVRVGLDLVHSRHDCRELEELLQVRNGEVGYPDSLDLVWMLLEHLLHVLPGVAPVTILIRTTFFRHRARPVHEPEVEIWRVQCLERGIECRGDVALVRVVKLGGQEDLLAGHPRLLDALADFLLVACAFSQLWFANANFTDVLTVCRCGIDVTVAMLEGMRDRLLNGPRLRPPRPYNRSIRAR